MLSAGYCYPRCFPGLTNEAMDIDTIAEEDPGDESKQRTFSSISDEEELHAHYTSETASLCKLSLLLPRWKFFFFK